MVIAHGSIAAADEVAPTPNQRQANNHHDAGDAQRNQRQMLENVETISVQPPASARARQRRHLICQDIRAASFSAQYRP